MRRVLSFFTLSLLIKTRVHIGSRLNFWYGEAYYLVYGLRFGFYVMNLDLTILQIKQGIFCFERNSRVGLNALISSGQHLLKDRTIVELDLTVQKGLFFSAYKWLAGLFTNFKVFINGRIFYNLLENIKLQKGMSREKRSKALNLYRRLRGFYRCSVLPSVVLILDSHINFWIIRETHKLMIPSFVSCDMNVFHNRLSTYNIPANIFSRAANLMFIVVFKNAFILGLLKKKRFFLTLVNFAVRFMKKSRQFYVFSRFYFVYVCFSLLIRKLTLQDKQL